jgi:hypothetical protein
VTTTPDALSRRTLEPSAIRNPLIRQRLARLVDSRDQKHRTELLGHIRADFQSYLAKEPSLCPRCLRPTGVAEERDPARPPVYHCSSCGQVWVL